MGENLKIYAKPALARGDCNNMLTLQINEAVAIKLTSLQAGSGPGF